MLEVGEGRLDGTDWNDLLISELRAKEYYYHVGWLILLVLN